MMRENENLPMSHSENAHRNEVVWAVMIMIRMARNLLQKNKQIE